MIKKEKVVKLIEVLKDASEKVKLDSEIIDRHVRHLGIFDDEVILTKNIAIANSIKKTRDSLSGLLAHLCILKEDSKFGGEIESELYYIIQRLEQQDIVL